MGPWPPCVVVRVSKNGDQTLGFCILEAEEEIYGIGFAKGLRKTNRSQGRHRLDGATAVAFDSSDVEVERPCGGGEGSGSLELNDDMFGRSVWLQRW